MRSAEGLPAARLLLAVLLLVVVFAVATWNKRYGFIGGGNYSIGSVFADAIYGDKYERPAWARYGPNGLPPRASAEEVLKEAERFVPDNYKYKSTPVLDNK